MIDTKAGCCFGTALCNCDNLTERKFRLWIFTVLCLCSRTGGRSVWRTSPPWPVCSGRAGLRLFAPVPMRAVPSSEHWRAERWDAGNLIFIIFAETEELFDEEYKFYMQNENKSMQTIISSCCSSCMNDTAAIFFFFLPPPGSRCVQAFVPLSVRKAPASIPNGHDRRRYRQTPLLPLRGVQIPRSGISFLERGLVFSLSLYLHQMHPQNRICLFSYYISS